MTINFTLSGRFVQGNAFVASTKDQQGNLRVVKTGPNIGQPSPQFFLAVAMPKNDPNWPAIKAQFDAETAAAWPQGQFNSPTFSSKITDGDGVDKYGQPWSKREGFAGHRVVKLSGSFAPKVYIPGSGAWIETTNPKDLECGDYVMVQGTYKSNENAQNPGMYCNLGLVGFVQKGVPIIQGPDVNAAFGAPPPGAAHPSAAGVTLPAPVAGPAPPPPPAVRTPLMTAKAGATPYASYIAAGWTDAQLVEQGLMDAIPY